MPIGYKHIEGPTGWDEVPARKMTTVVAVEPEKPTAVTGEASLAVAMTDPSYWKPPTDEELKEWKERNKAELRCASFVR